MTGEAPDERDLGRYEQAYGESRFEEVQARYRKRLLVEVLDRVAPASVLEVGCALDTIANHWPGAERFVVIEPGAGFAEKARRDLAGRTGAELIEATLDEAVPNLAGDFDLILLSGLLHELPDCAPTLAATRALCGPDTLVHVNVPNALSFHRLLAVEMGLIDHPDQPSDLQRRLQQHSTFTLASLKALLAAHGLHAIEEGSYFVKPFTHAQMQELLDAGVLDQRMLDGLWGMARHMPALGSEIFVNARAAGGDAA